MGDAEWDKVLSHGESRVFEPRAEEELVAATGRIDGSKGTD